MVTEERIRNLRNLGLDLRLPLTTADGTVLEPWTTVAPSGLGEIAVLSGPKRGETFEVYPGTVNTAIGK